MDLLVAISALLLPPLFEYKGGVFRKTVTPAEVDDCMTTNNITVNICCVSINQLIMQLN